MPVGPPWLWSFTELFEGKAARMSWHIPGHHRVHILPHSCGCIFSDCPGETRPYGSCVFREAADISTAFPGGSAVQDLVAKTGDAGGLGFIPGGGNGNPLPCSCLENPVDRGALRAIVHGVTNSWTTERLNNNKTSAQKKEARPCDGRRGARRPAPPPRILGGCSRELRGTEEKDRWGPRSWSQRCPCQNCRRALLRICAPPRVYIRLGKKEP